MRTQNLLAITLLAIFSPLLAVAGTDPFPIDELLEMAVEEQSPQLKAEAKAKAEANTKAEAEAKTKAEAKAKAKAKTKAKAEAEVRANIQAKAKAKAKTKAEAEAEIISQVIPLPLPPHRSVNKTEQPTIITAEEMIRGKQNTSVKVGAREFALARGCQFMKVYKVATNIDFTETLKLVKYRSSALGAEYITIIHHQEGGSHNAVQGFFDATYLVGSSTTQRPTIKTVMAVEMYDCEE